MMPPDDKTRPSPPSPSVGGLNLGDVLPLRELLGRSQPTTTAIGVDGPRVIIVHHILPCVPPLPCVSLMTDSLRRLGRDELILTVPVTLLAVAPYVPAHLLKTITAALDNWPRLGPGAFLGASHPEWPNLTGFALERAWPMNGVELPPGCLSLHALVDNELQAAEALGSLRVLSRLGQVSRFWPTPAWCDPRREATAGPGERTFLGRVSTAHFPGITVTLESPTIVLRVSRATLPLLSGLAELDPRQPLALFTSLNLRADALLSWSPGESAATVNTRNQSPAARLAGCFFAVLPGKAANGGGVLEDGFAMSLTQPSADQFRQALVAGEPLEIRSGRAFGLRLEWTGELA